jgi:hypothetical protein
MASGALTTRADRSRGNTVARGGRKADDLFEMANLYPRTTGLPMTIWVSQQGRTRHDARVKVCTAHGDKMDISHTAVVGIRPQPRLIEGQLTATDLRQVAAWINLNEDALMDLWRGTIDFAEFVPRLHHIRASGPSPP